MAGREVKISSTEIEGFDGFSELIISDVVIGSPGIAGIGVIKDFNLIACGFISGFKLLPNGSSSSPRNRFELDLIRGKWEWREDWFIFILFCALDFDMLGKFGVFCGGRVA